VVGRAPGAQRAPVGHARGLFLRTTSAGTYADARSTLPPYHNANPASLDLGRIVKIAVQYGIDMLSLNRSYNGQEEITG
jgi:hypothetical protein